jgi:hypothetical protein
MVNVYQFTDSEGVAQALFTAHIASVEQDDPDVAESYIRMMTTDIIYKIPKTLPQVLTEMGAL